jgi:hypothetical protein
MKGKLNSNKEKTKSRSYIDRSVKSFLPTEECVNMYNTCPINDTVKVLAYTYKISSMLGKGDRAEMRLYYWASSQDNQYYSS